MYSGIWISNFVTRSTKSYRDYERIPNLDVETCPQWSYRGACKRITNLKSNNAVDNIQIQFTPDINAISHVFICISIMVPMFNGIGDGALSFRFVSLVIIMISNSGLSRIEPDEYDSNIWKCHINVWLPATLTHCSPMTPYGEMALGQHWLR